MAIREDVAARASVLAVAATSTAGFARLIPLVAGATDDVRTLSVLVVGIPEPNLLVAVFGPWTGMIRHDQVRAEAVRRVQRAAHAAVASLPADVSSRHWVCSGWRDAALRSGLRRYDCERLYVHRADMPAWCRRIIRSRLAAAGVSLVVVDTAATATTAPA